jgi:DNA-directed RNA polymerase specialized sigma24 family protein
MNESSGASVPGSDAELLNKIRSGDPRPAAVLRARHTAAARSLAGHLTLDAAAADDMVATAFTQVLDAITLGGGPSDAFRPYLLSAVRRAAHASVSRQAAPIPTDEQQIPDPGQPLTDPAAGRAGSPVVAAFLSLPERWQAVLWHVEVERAAPAEAAPLLGLSPAEITDLAGRARDGLVRAYLQIQAATGSGLGAGLADAGVSDALRGAVAPIFLGGAAAAYLAERSGPADARGARAAGGASGTVGAAAAAAWVTGKVHGSSRQQRTVAAGAGALLAIFGVGAYVLFQGHGAGTVSAAGQHAAPGSATPTVTPSGVAARRPGSGGRSGQGSHRGHRGAPVQPRPGGGSLPPTGATPVPSTTALPSPRPTASSPVTSRSSPPTVRPTPPTAQVSAQISVSGPGFGDVAGVAFGIADTGPAATRNLTATISLPAGAVLMTSSHRSSGPPGPPGTNAYQGPPGAAGWSCQAIAGGAACAHGPIAATARIGGVIAVRITGSAACGKYVQVTVTGGASPASAQSAGTIQCSQHRRGFAADLATYAGSQGRPGAAGGASTGGGGGDRPGPSRRGTGPGSAEHRRHGRRSGGRWLAGHWRGGHWLAGHWPTRQLVGDWQPGPQQFGRSSPGPRRGGRWPGRPRRY